MRRSVTGLLLAAVVLVGCETGSTGGATVDPVDEGAYADAAEASDLAEALAAGQRIVDDLVASLDVDERARDDVRPYRVSLCDETTEGAPRLVSVARGIAFDPGATDDVSADTERLLEAAGVDGVRVVGGDGVVPLVTGVFAGDRWQVAATLNREDGIGEVRVNSACLPGDVPDPPASS